LDFGPTSHLWLIIFYENYSGALAVASTKKYGGAEPQKQSRYGGMLRGKKRAGKNFPSPDPFPFLPARFGGAGALPPIVAFKSFFKFLFACVLP